MKETKSSFQQNLVIYSNFMRPSIDCQGLCLYEHDQYVTYLMYRALTVKKVHQCSYMRMIDQRTLTEEEESVYHWSPV